MMAVVVFSNKTHFMEINKALKVEASKSFPVTASQLYNAWTNPEELKQWWKPMGNALKEVVNDIKTGGAVRYIFADNALVISGEYLEVKENEKLVYTWNWELPNDAVRNAAYKLTVNFAGKDNGSEISISQENFQDEEAMLPHRQGWEKGLDELEHFLSGDSSSQPNQQTESTTAGSDTGGYREDAAQVKVGGG
jgi:uncharacterized protein YndB with AHSA1/START domain